MYSAKLICGFQGPAFDTPAFRLSGTTIAGPRRRTRTVSGRFGVDQVADRVDGTEQLQPTSPGTRVREHRLIPDNVDEHSSSRFVLDMHRQLALGEVHLEAVTELRMALAVGTFAAIILPQQLLRHVGGSLTQ